MTGMYDQDALDAPLTVAGLVERPTGMYVARLDCGHDYGPGKGHTGLVAVPGDPVTCRQGECGPGSTRQVVDVVTAGSVTVEGRRW